MIGFQHGHKKFTGIVPPAFPLQDCVLHLQRFTDNGGADAGLTAAF
jgi:hypothetical protein